MTSTHSDSQLLRRSAYSAPSGPGDLPFPGAHRRPRGDALADKRWGRHSAPSSGEKKNPAASLAPKVPRERDRQRRGLPAPSARAISRVPPGARLQQMGTERAGCVPSPRSRTGGGCDGWSPRCSSQHRRRGAGPPIDGTAANCHDHRGVGVGWGERAGRRLLTTLVQGEGGKTQPGLLKRQAADGGRRGKLPMDAAVGGPELQVRSQRSPCRALVSLRGGGRNCTMAPGTWAPGGSCPRDTDNAGFISLWQVDGC